MLTSLQANFAVDRQHAAYAISVFALAHGVMQLFFGPLGDRFGKVKIIAFAALGCAVGNIGAFASDNLNQLLVARAVSGAAAAGIVPLTMAWIGDTVGYERRQEILARLLGATVFGTIFGQWAGGAIPSVASWRIAFLVIAVMFGIAGTLTFMQARMREGVADPVQGQFLHNTASVFQTSWARVVLAITMVEGCLAYGALAFLPTHVHEAIGLPISQAALVVGLYGIGGLVYSRVAVFLLPLPGAIHWHSVGRTAHSTDFDIKPSSSERYRAASDWDNVRGSPAAQARTAMIVGHRAMEKEVFIAYVLGSTKTQCPMWSVKEGIDDPQP
ncbi:MFS transporter [Paraburkholderia ribeironis]|nr:MFS transporter [Paraburkholderia ribeironis]